MDPQGFIALEQDGRMVISWRMKSKARGSVRVD
jgi:hypothetical protein